MAYVGNLLDWDLEALRKNGSGNDAWRFGSFRSSTRFEGAPHFSPDGKRLAFESNRSGLFGIWVSEVDGTGAQLLWDGYGGMPRWSPDSQRIAFDSLVDGDFNIYISSSSGGPPLRLTDHPSTDQVPNWSADGSSVYFASDRSGKFEIWKVSAAGGEPQQMTREGGSLPVESPDGRFVYYLEAQGAPFRGHRPVWRIPVGGGEPSKILERVWARNYAVTRGGIYFIEQPGGLGPGAAFAFRFLDSKSGMIRTLITLPPNVIPGHSFAVSSDEQTILYTRVKMTGSDLMLIENFR
jgi:dipeptidyl aminopeptidase/acylaminoacyl peptidase